MSAALPAQERRMPGNLLPQTTQPVPYCLVSPQELCDLTEQCVRMGESIKLDTETTALDPWASRLVTVQIGGASETPWTCDVRHVGPADLTALAGMVRLLVSGRIELIGHNLKFDVLHLAVALGIQPEELSRLRTYDTLLAEQVILGGRESEQGGRERADLAATAGRYGYVLSKDPRSWFADLDKRPEWNEPLPPEQLEYAAQDIAVLEGIRRGQVQEIAAQRLEPTIRLEMACLPAIAAMELRGIRLGRVCTFTTRSRWRRW